MNEYARAVVVALSLALAAPIMGCASKGGRTEESQSAVTSLSDTRNELAKGKAEVNDANTALERLSSAGGNLDQTFKQYSAAVGDVQKAGERARDRAKDMRENARLYVANWEKETQQIDNPELKAGAAARRQRVQDNYQKIETASSAVRDAYRPYLKDLQDIQRALASDLTPSGVSAAKSAIDKTRAAGTELNARIDALIAQLDEVSAGMSSTVGATKVQ